MPTRAGGRERVGVRGRGALRAVAMRRVGCRVNGSEETIENSSGAVEAFYRVASKRCGVTRRCACGSFVSCVRAARGRVCECRACAMCNRALCALVEHRRKGRRVWSVERETRGLRATSVRGTYTETTHRQRAGAGPPAVLRCAQVEST